MPSSNVSFPLPLTRLNPWYPGQFGVPGAWTDTGLRQHCTGTIFYVDPNMPGVSDQRDGTDPIEPLATVAAAIARCQPYRGDVIAVMANNNWIYDNPAAGYGAPISESVVLNVPGVRLVGVSQSAVTGVPWLGLDSSPAIVVTAMNCTIEGFAFLGDNGTIAIQAIWGGGDYGENLTVRNCVFDSDWAVAIQLGYCYNCDIHHNWFLGPDIGVANDDAVIASQYVHVHHNWFFDCHTTAVHVGEGNYWKVYENQIWNTNAADGNAATDEMVMVSTGGHNFVHHNTMSCVLPGVPVPLPGDYDDCNTAGAGDVWAQNYCLDGPSVTNPT